MRIWQKNSSKFEKKIYKFPQKKSQERNYDRLLICLECCKESTEYGNGNKIFMASN